MNRVDFRSMLLRGCVAGLAGVCLAAGCGQAPSTSSSGEEATIKGLVTFEGKPVKKGSITFDPSNVNRRMASATTATINGDGTYSVNSLVGRNTISFNLPGLGTSKNKLNYAQIFYEVKPGENTFNAELPQK